MPNKRKQPPTQIMLLGETFALPKPRFGRVNIDQLPIVHGLAPDAAFIESIARFGVVEPVVVVACEGELVLANGRRRVLAAKQVGLAQVPTLIYTFDADHVGRLELIAATMTMLLNELRHDNPLADLHAITQLRAQGATDRDITQVTGMLVSRIRRREKLTRLIPNLFDAWANGQVGTRLAEVCAALTEVTQLTLVRQLEASGTLTFRDVADAREARQHQAQESLSLAGFDALIAAAAPSASLADIANALSPATAQRVAEELPLEPQFDEARQQFAARGAMQGMHSTALLHRARHMPELVPLKCSEKLPFILCAQPDPD